VDVFEDVAGYSVGFLGLASGGSRPERVLVSWVTGNYFPVLDIRPVLGRLIRADEGAPGRRDPVAVLGHSTWQRRFRGDPSVIGRTVTVNGVPCTIVGVAPAGFSGTFAFSESELYLPLNWDGGGGLEDRAARGLHAIARLRPGVGLERARAEMNVLAARLAWRYPDSHANLALRVLPERLARPEEDQFRTNTLGAAIVLGMVILVMAVAAVNVANLLLARTEGRYRELAIRSALGAGRSRLVRQMVTETLLLTGLGGGVGVLLGAWLADALSALRLPGDLPVRFDFRLDGRVLGYAAAVSVLTGLLVGVSSALRVSGAELDRALRGSRTPSPSPGHRMRRLLVVAQVASCFLLLSMAGLFTRSLLEAGRADLGFQPERVLNLHMDVGQLGYTEARGRAFFAEVERRVRSIPGVERASYAFTVPMGYVRVGRDVEAAAPATGRGGRVFAGTNMVGTEYFQALGIPVLHGRSFDDGDTERSPSVAVVNQRLADVLWPGQDPVGRRFRSDGQWTEVVGVVGTGKYEFLFEDPRPFFYVPMARGYSALRVLHVGTALPPGALAPAVEREIRAVEPDLPLHDVQTMTQALGSGLGFFPVRVGAMAVAAFGLLAFALAIVGLYGLTAYLTSQRTHEIGVRMAVGATGGQIVRLVLGEGAKLVLLGVTAGLLATLACARIAGRFLFGVSAHDPVTFLSVTPVLTGVALIACAVPAWRAAHVDPTSALRS
jgi:predicted permease